jgi:dipeptidase D
MEIKDLEPKSLFGLFASLLGVPRESGNEAKAREFVLNFARAHGLEAHVDEVGNVIARVKGSSGCEACEPVVLQAHLDMVCVQSEDTVHDFRKDRIPAYVDGDFIRTKGTTLGADNGIGLCAGLAVATDKDFAHPPLELVFTIEEETGLTGASNLKPSSFAGRKLINLDSEEEGFIYIGCAGGADATIHLKLGEVVERPNYVWVKVEVGGVEADGSFGSLAGGHSGIEIDKGRGNALKILARAIACASEGMDFVLGDIWGGSRKNVIPSRAVGYVFVPEAMVSDFLSRISRFEGVVREELKFSDKLCAIRCTVGEQPSDKRCSPEELLKLMLALPHGVLGMSQALKGLVETSSNLAIVRREGNEALVACNTRSSVASQMEAVRLQIKACGELANGKVVLGGEYPSWQPDVESPLLQVAKQVHKEVFGVEPTVTAVHAGLECAVIKANVPDIDPISIGPNITGAHSVKESCSISSVQRFYRYLKAILSYLAKNT